MNDMKNRVLSGIRATGRLHLGNYLGAVKGMLELQAKSGFETLYMVADVHAITTPYNAQELRIYRREVVLDYLASGIDPNKSTLFLQSMVSEHLELAFLFSSIVSIARMQHLPTFKEKIKQYPENSTMALLNYPILMAADILLYKASLVPVGMDQEPHLEIAREIARKMNSEYDLDFPEPQRFVTSGEYVPSLTGVGKMSKSVLGSYILLTDDLSTISTKLSKTPTDSGRGTIELVESNRLASLRSKKYIDQSNVESIGVANLMLLVELFEGEHKRAEYDDLYQTTGISYRQLKQDLAQAIYDQMELFQERRKELINNTLFVDEVIESGAQRARQIAQDTISQVKYQMGLG